MIDFRKLLAKHRIPHKHIQIYEIKFIDTKSGLEYVRKIRSTDNFKTFRQWAKYKFKELTNE